MITISLSVNFHENLSCLKASRTLLKNDDNLLEFRRTWRFLTWAGVIDHVYFCLLLFTFDDDKLIFKNFLKSVMFEGVKNPPEE